MVKRQKLKILVLSFLVNTSVYLKRRIKPGPERALLVSRGRGLLITNTLVPLD